MLPCIIDLEASGFGAGSYPIEVGVVLADRTTHCFLIRPDAEWTHWNKQAEQVHGISREELLQYGRPIREVATCLNGLLDRQIIYTDAWGVDSSWLAKLYDAAGIIPLYRLETIRKILSEKQLNLWDQCKQKVVEELNLKRHRASADAKIIQRTYELTLHSN